MMEYVKKMKMQMKKKNENKKATMKWQLRTQEFRKSLEFFFHFFIIIFFIFLSFSSGEVPILQQEQPKCWKN